MKTVISNPPYNIKWEHPIFAMSLPRFDVGVPPKNNANFAFILNALENNDRAVFVLPNQVLTSEQKDEKMIRRGLVDKNWVEAVISLPGNMFTSTSIPTCILIFNKNKDDTYTRMIDLLEECAEEVREQHGQFGVQRARVYKKIFKIIPEKKIEEVVDFIEKGDEISYGTKASIQDIAAKGYNLSPNRYLERESEIPKHRSYTDIVSDLNSISMLRGGLKITINKNIAKSLGFQELLEGFEKEEIINKHLEEVFRTIGFKKKYNRPLVTTANRELKIEVKDFERIPEFLNLFLTMWRQYMIEMNNRENFYLIELRDALIPDLMSGRISFDKEREVENEQTGSD